MKPFEDRRARIEAYKRQKQKDNSLEISNVSSEKGDIVSFEVKGKGEGKVTTSKEEKKVDDDVVVPAPPVILAWERYVDELAHEQQWIEVMAMRSGLGLVFVVWSVVQYLVLVTKTATKSQQTLNCSVWLYLAVYSLCHRSTMSSTVCTGCTTTVTSSVV